MQAGLVGEAFLAVLGLLPKQPNPASELLKVPLAVGLAVGGCHPFDRRHDWAAVHSSTEALCGVFAASRQKILKVPRKRLTFQPV